MYCLKRDNFVFFLLGYIESIELVLVIGSSNFLFVMRKILKKIIFLSVYVEELIKLIYFEIVNYIDVLFI